MKLSNTVTTTIKEAAAKALATNGPRGINVVPVSMVRVTDDAIWLFDFFMEKTVENIESDPEVALTACTDMTGVQIKATNAYYTEGPEFDEGVAWAKEDNPERVVKGVLVLSPTAVYDISPGGAYSDADLALH
jgi:predicted pyridoxine 5'-phosphate oxidase superfamily flavin-nucleotide-binding protein